MAARDRCRAARQTHGATVRACIVTILSLAAGAAANASAPVNASEARTPLPDSLSIEQCIGLARANAPAVVASAADLRAARFESEAAMGNRTPKASLFASVLAAPRGFYDPAITNLGEYEIKAGVSVPLLDGGEAARDRARAAGEAAIASSQLDAASREAGLRAGRLAVEILIRSERVRFDAQSLSWIGDLASTIASRVRAGSSGPADSMRIGIEHDAIEAALDSTRTGLEASRRELASLIGVPIDALPPIRSMIIDAALAPTSADSLALIARTERFPEVAEARSDEALTRLDLADALHRNDLRADLSADAGLAGTDLTGLVPEEMKSSDPGATFADRLRRDLGASATIDLHRQIYDRTRRPSVEARRAAQEAASARVAGATRDRERAALDLLARWRAAARAVLRARGMVDRSETNLIRAKSLYIAGAAGILDILDARRTLDDARESLIDARAFGLSARVEMENLP